MEKPESLKRAGDPKYIPGIYNYCDRWCERCPFTQRCMNYDGVNEQLEGKEPDSMDQQEFWDKIEESFNETRKLLEYFAHEQGIDLDNLEPDPEYERKREQLRKDAEEHPLAKASYAYAMKVHKWMMAASPMLEEKEAELNRNQELGMNEEATEEAGLQIADALEVIRWYNFQINVKLMRALQHNDMFDDEEDDEFQSDADGSAKVALLGMDRSIGAWGTLRQHFPDREDEILDFLVQLEKLRRHTEEAYPKARDFVRPGFDTGHSPIYQG